MLPRMKEYFARMPRPQLDGGYYTKARENRPLVGPTGVDGAYVVGAVSGYGIMSACGAGEFAPYLKRDTSPHASSLLFYEACGVQ